MATALLNVGRYLLREFFDDDPEAAEADSRSKTNSFRDLAARPDVPFSHETLWRAVRIAIQDGDLADLPGRERLSSTHRTELISVGDAIARRELARRAIDERWSSRRLREEVRRQSPGRATGVKRGGGRRSEGRNDSTETVGGSGDGAEKGLRRALEAAIGAARRASAPDRVAKLDAGRRKRIAVELREAIAAFREALAAFERR